MAPEDSFAQGSKGMLRTMEMNSLRRRNRGFTLLEMVSVMGIVGILMAIGVPSYKSVTNSNRVASEGNSLLGDLQYARSEAIKEGQFVTVCISTNGSTCATGTNLWNSGWLVFSDSNSNATVDATAIKLRSQTVFTGTDTFTGSNGVTGIGAITFNREGFAAGLATGAMMTLHTAPAVNSYTRCLAVSLVGLMAIQHYDGTICL
jgi:type IV fimbrial biogenesis protein FimT